MKRLPFLLSALILMSVCSASTAPPLSPEVHSDRTITFRLRMPNAQKVDVSIDTGITLPMSKDEDGMWSAVIPTLTPDIYGYSFVVDGVVIADPMNTQYKTNMLTAASLVEVPDTTPLPWDQTDIPHGEVHHHFYKSASAGDERDFYVYTPPGYRPRAKKRYPVLYLLHGFTDRANAWVDVGRANFILDWLIDQGKAKAMIVVMPLGYGVPTYAARTSPNFGDARLTQQNFDTFRETLLTELMPQVEKMYPTLSGRNNHAIAGLSMGGSETLDTALNHSDAFAWVGSFSLGELFSGIAKDNYPLIFPGLDRQPAPSFRLLWIACGTEDGFFSPNQKLIDWLREKGLQPVAIQTPGSHNWTVWRRNLLAFVPLLFQ
jgi:enterochelin esterase family protein